MWILVIIGLIIGFVALQFWSDYEDGLITKNKPKPETPKPNHKSFRLTKED